MLIPVSRLALTLALALTLWHLPCAELKDFTTICSSAPSEALAIIVLRSRDTILARNRSMIETNKALLRAFFERHKTKFAWHEPR